MAKRISIEFVDDSDPSMAADETVEFAIDGVNYEIDLSKTNAAQLRRDMQTWVEHATYVSGRKKRKILEPNGSGRGNTYRAMQIRAWAMDRGIELPPRGRIPNEVIDQYLAERDA